jgi:EAL domain-containing protein (putative c-di-GMP-specific phosphodiesterase class I)
VLNLTQLQGAIQDASDPSGVMSRVVDEAAELIPATEGAAIVTAIEDELTIVWASGTLAGEAGVRLPLSRSLCGDAISSGQTLLCDDTESDERVDLERCREINAASAVSVPLLRQGEAIGALTIIASRPAAFDRDDVTTLSRLAGFISVAVGSVWDLARITSELLDGIAADVEAPPGAGLGRAGGFRPQDRERIGQFVANVLRPGIVADLAARQRIERALNGDGFEMRFQPIVDVATGEIIAAEALARFPRSAQPTDVWFTEAERFGLGTQLQLAAVAKALDCLPQLPPEVSLTINVGPDVIAAPALPELLRTIDARRVVLELTEHLAIADYLPLHASLTAIRRHGIRLAVDDTGAGFSTLGHIVNLGPDLIKLDRTFTAGIDTDGVRRSLARALVIFAGDIDAKVVSEGIETAGELQTIRDLGIQYGQGYFIGRPMPADRLPRG